jgi:starvation-inducible DNA-binding protein
MSRLRQLSMNVHKLLATPTDLKKESVEKVSAALNPLIADTFALYIKTKNYHWHVASSHFRDYHLLLDDQAESIYNSIDPLAERVRRIGGVTIRSISHISSLQKVIKDDNEDFVEPEKMITHLIADNLNLLKEQRSAHSICDSSGDCATTSILEDHIDECEKRIWFLNSVHAGGSHMK